MILRKKKKYLLFNFLKTNTTRRKKPLRFFKFALYFLVFLIFLLGIGLIRYYPTFKNFYSYALRGKQNFELTQNYISKEDYSKAYLSLLEANSNFENAQKELLKIKIFRFVPFIGQQYSIVEKLVFAGLQTGRAIEKITKLVLEITNPFKKDNKISLSQISQNDKEFILKKIYESTPDLQGAKAEIDLANIALNQIPKYGLLSPIKKALKPFKDNLPTIQKAINQVIPITQILPKVAGYPEEQVYLFLLQNNTELRPTGGFIGTYGILKIKNGEIASFWTDNSYNLDDKATDLKVTPPWPLSRYNKVEKWYFRDSNWSPDYPTSAEKAIWFYDQEGGQEKKIDGVIAVTPSFIESLIKITGDITIDNTTFTPDNFVDTLQYQVEKGYLRQGLEVSKRKEIIGELGKNLIARLQNLPQTKWKDLWKIIEKDLNEKQVLIYLTNKESENLLVNQNWAGEIKSVDHDYLSVIDANLASLKSDPGVERTIDYVLMKENNKLKAVTSITYRNKGTFTWKTTRYRSYVRVFAPLGSTFENIVGTDESHEIVDDLNKTSFGTFITIEPGETKTIIFYYWLPDNILEMLNRGSYKILVQKQPGASAYGLTLNLNPGKPIKKFSPIDNGKKEDNNVIKFSTDLAQDKYFSLEFK